MPQILLITTSIKSCEKILSTSTKFSIFIDKRFIGGFRDTFHVHLFNKENVIATAIGKFRIRKQDPDSTDPSPS